MQNYTLGVFTSPEQAEAAVTRIHNELSVPSDQISFLYKDKHGNLTEGTEDSAPVEGAKKGAAIGGMVGAGLGIATVVGLIPVIGPIFAAGPLLAALGLGAGAVGTTAAGALTGAAAGGLVGALVNLGLSETAAQEYQDRVSQGNVLVAIKADPAIDIASVLRAAGGTDVNTYSIN